MKIWLCTIAKMEENYIREWIEYHKSIGIDHIIIGDNNDSKYEKPLYPVIKDYIDEGYVTLIPKHDKKYIQIEFFNEAYHEYADCFDYISFIDVDSYIELPRDKKIVNLLKGKTDFDAVLMNWIVYNDNDKIYFEDKPLRERFTSQSRVNRLNYFVNYICKPNLGDIKWIYSPPTDNVCDVNGNSNICRLWYADGAFAGKDYNFTETYRTAFLGHYITKSTEEYINIKMKRGTAQTADKIIYTKRFYFSINIWNKDKEKIFNKYLKFFSKKSY